MVQLKESSVVGDDFGGPVAAGMGDVNHGASLDPLHGRHAVAVDEVHGNGVIRDVFQVLDGQLLPIRHFVNDGRRRLLKTCGSFGKILTDTASVWSDRKTLHFPDRMAAWRGG